MSIFGKLNNSTYDFPAVEGYGCEDLGDMIINTEAYDDMTDIIKSIHALDTLEIQGKREIANLEESGSASYVIQDTMDKYEATYEAWYGSAWESIKKFFVNLGKKIKAFFDSIIRWFASFYMTAKKYADKYGKQIINLEATGKLKGYKIKTFENESLLAQNDRTVEEIFKRVYDFAKHKSSGTHEAVKKNTENKDELDKELRGKLLGSSAKLTKENYTDELYSLFRGGNAKSTEDKKEVELSASNVIAFLKKDDGLKAARKASEEMTKQFSLQISEMEKLAGHLGDKDKAGEEEYDTGRVKSDGTKEDKAKHMHKKDYSGRATTNLEGEETPGITDEEYRTGAIAGARLSVHIFNSGKTDGLALVNAWKNAIEEKITDYMRYCRGAFSHKESKD